MQNKLLAIQRDLKAPKGQYNSFGKYSYRSCEDILEAVKPLCVREGLLLTISDEVVQIGARYYVRATAAISDGEKAISVSALAREEDQKKGMDGSQITGAASSYARKYALNGLFCIDDTKDADAQGGAKSATKDALAIVREAAALAKKEGIQPMDLSEIVKRRWKKSSSKELTIAEAEDLKANYHRYWNEILDMEAAKNE